MSDKEIIKKTSFLTVSLFFFVGLMFGAVMYAGYNEYVEAEYTEIAFSYGASAACLLQYEKSLDYSGDKPISEMDVMGCWYHAMELYWGAGDEQ